MNESKGKAYVVGQIKIIDLDKWQQYRDQVAATLVPWGGEVVFRGKKAEALALPNPYTDIVVIQFTDLKAASSWFNCAGYQAIIPLREEAAEVMLTSYQA